MNLKRESILEQEIVLINIEDKPAFYARVEAITTDVKPKWWRVKFLFLTIPLQVATWIIDDEQIRGADFTMGGTPFRIEKIVIPEEARPPEDESQKSEPDGGEPTHRGRILSLHRKESKPGAKSENTDS